MEDVDYGVMPKEIRKNIFATVGHTLCVFRKDMGYSLADAAKMIGYKPEKLQKIEDGGSVSIPAFMRIVATYGGHVLLETRKGTYSLEEIYSVPPFTQEEIDSREMAKKLEKVTRTRDWLNKMAAEWDDERDGL